jgi:branched-chain amino acid aminotransferase
LIVWVNGTLLPEEEACISPFDHGLLTGDGVFETLRVYGGVPFAWTRHLQRLARSAGGLDLPLPPSGTLRRAAGEVLAANRLEEARLRITVTGGPAPLGSDRGPGAQPTAVVASSTLADRPPTTAVATVGWSRNEGGALAGLKTTSYGENVRALAHATARGAGEAVLPNTRGNLCEGTGTNVFLVTGGRLITPPESSGCLLGVTRGLILELATHLGCDVAETDVPISALAGADEAFLTSSTREVQPISEVDGRPLPSAPGPVTARLAEAFADLVAKEMDP